VEVNVINSLPQYGDEEGWVFCKIENYDPEEDGSKIFVFWNLCNVAQAPYKHWRFYEKMRGPISGLVDSNGIIAVESVHNLVNDPYSAGFLAAIFPADWQGPLCAEPNQPEGEIECVGNLPMSQDYLPNDVLLYSRSFDWTERPIEPDEAKMSSLAIPWFE